MPKPYKPNPPAASQGFRRQGRSHMRLRIWTKLGVDPVERDGEERELVAEFHRLKDEGRVVALALDAVGTQGGTWISWRNPAQGPERTCPHCGAPL